MKGSVKQMRAIVTGATGMLGWNLIQYLIQKDFQVLAVVNPASKRKNCIPEHRCVTIWEVDIQKLCQQQLKEKYDYFFHLGWRGTHGEAREDIYLQEENARDALRLVDFAKESGCSVFVGAGSQAEYGMGISDKLNGTMPANPVTAYGIGKYMAGILTGKRCRQLGMRHQWVRILSVYGPGDGEHTMVMSGIRTLLQGGIPLYTNAEQQWDYLYVGDAVKALYLIAEKGIDQKIYCLGSGRSRLLRDYILDIRNAVDPKLEISLGALSYPENQVMYLCADISELCEDTGFQVEVPFSEGIRRTVDWVKGKMKHEED